MSNSAIDAPLQLFSDALAKTVALTRDEREVNAVFDVIEPFAALYGTATCSTSSGNSLSPYL